jgi:S-adenosylmethionine:diacylglycerol 3-amino-3-carboxypropyl transferase
MKTIEKIEKQFDAVKFMREQRDKLSRKLSKMTKEEVIEYFTKRKAETSIKPSA